MDLLKLPGVVYCEFPPNSCLIRQGEKVAAVYYLLEGICYRKTITEKGDEIIYGVKESNHQNFVQSLVGVLVLYSSDGVSVSNFFARTKCCCYKIPTEILLAYLRDKPAMLTQIITMAMRELRKLTFALQARQEGKVANQLCNLLLQQAQLKQGKLIVDKGYSNLAISQFLGVHKVTVARILRVLKVEGLIDKNKDGIRILDAKRLEAFARQEKIEY